MSKQQQAQKIFYDIEIFPYDFSFGMFNRKKKIVSVIVLNSRPTYELHEVLEEVQAHYPEYTVNIIDGRKSSNWHRTLHTFGNNYRSKKPVEWLGWNSARYDLMLMAVFSVYLEQRNKVLSPFELRQLSDEIIVGGARYPKKFFEKAQQLFLPDYEITKLMRERYYDYQNGLLHIDVGALNEKSRNSRVGEVFPFSLKEVSAYMGLDVLDDPITSVEFSGWTRSKWESLSPKLQSRINSDGSLTKDGLVEMLIYNIRDIINTSIIFDEPEYKGELDMKDKLRELFPYITTAPTGYDSFHQISRDATSAQFSGKIIRGRERTKLKDIPKVSFDFPLPDGETVDLLDYAVENEPIHSNARIFYSGFRDKSMNTPHQYDIAIDNSFTRQSTMNIPYMNKDNRAMSSFITLSVGGAHGTTADGLYGRKMDDYSWLTDVGQQSLSSQVFTIDIRNVIHVDVKSYYPTLNTILGVFQTMGQDDNYARLLAERFSLQDDLKELQRIEDEFTQAQSDLYDNQNAFKLVLNSGTGEANTFMQNNPYTDLPLDNATISMRMIGNVLIYILGQRLATNGALVVSTNTDGLHLANIELDVVEEIIEEFEVDYGLTLDVVEFDRYIERTTNERIEIVDGEIVGVSGDLRRAYDNTFSPRLNRNRQRMDGFPNYPRICGRAVLDYFVNNHDWLYQAIINTSQLKKILRSYIEEEFYALDWIHVVKGNQRRKYVLRKDGVDTELQSTNRIIFTSEDTTIHEYFDGNTRKITGAPSENVRVVNKEEELWNTPSDVIDLDTYAQWASDLATKWLKSGDIPELNIGEEPVEQVNLFDLYNQ